MYITRSSNDDITGLHSRPLYEGQEFLKDASLTIDPVKIYRDAVGVHIDEMARLLGFDSIITAVSYADESSDPLNQSHGLALRAWRSICWEHCRTVLVTWQGGGSEPTVNELIAGLPEFTGV